MRFEFCDSKVALSICRVRFRWRFRIDFPRFYCNSTHLLLLLAAEFRATPGPRFWESSDSWFCATKFRRAASTLTVILVKSVPIHPPFGSWCFSKRGYFLVLSHIWYIFDLYHDTFAEASGPDVVGTLPIGRHPIVLQLRGKRKVQFQDAKEFSGNQFYNNSVSKRSLWRMAPQLLQAQAAWSWNGYAEGHHWRMLMSYASSMSHEPSAPH